MRNIFFLLGIAMMLLHPKTYAACTYDVAPIRTFLDTLAGKVNYEGPMTSMEKNPSGGTTYLNRFGVYSIQKPEANTWIFYGDFCTSSVCESSSIQYSIVDGCLKSFDTTLKVTHASSSSIYLYFYRDGHKVTRQLSLSSSSNKLKIFEKIFQEKILVYSSYFYGTWRPAIK